MSKYSLRAVAMGLVGLMVLPWAGPVVAQDEPVREIIQVAGDLYRFQNKFHHSVFVVTPEGIIATDPINADAAAWLKGELARKFGVPVRYLIYSHEHADHISGGEVFADTAVVVAHANAKAHIVADKMATAVPRITFEDRMTVELGGAVVELIYLGRNHSDSLIVMRFPQERVMFVVDIIGVNRVPYRDLPGADVAGWLDSLERLAAMDFDILVPGHGPMGTRADVAPHGRYIADLRDAVGAQIKAGKTLDETKQTVTMAAYKDWLRYADWQQLNVEGMYRLLK